MANYNYILTLMENSTGKLADTDPMKQVLNNLQLLNKGIQILNTLERADGPESALVPHKMSKNEYDQLLILYENLRKSARLAHKSGAKGLSYQYMDEMMRMVNRDLEALHRVKSPDQITDFHTMVDDSAHFTADISGKNLSFVGGSASMRVPFSVSDGKGSYINGYFTPDSRLIPDVNAKDAVQNAMNSFKDNQEISGALEKLSRLSLDDMGDQLFRNHEFRNKEKELAKFKPPVDNQPNKDDAMKTLSERWRQFLGLDNDFLLTEDQAKSLYTMASHIHGIGFSRAFNIADAGIAEGGVVGQRNAAMSAVADFLGVPELLARSNQISVKVGTNKGQPVYQNGTFMEKAAGDTVGNLKSKASDPDAISIDMDNPAMLKDISNLQVLDYICGNVDRHGGNFFLKSEVKNHVVTFTGLVGIDNDASFGILEPGKNNHCLKAPSNMGFVTEAMADKVRSMTKEDLQQILAGFGLKGSEISAAWKRTQALQKAISSKKLKAVTDEQLKNLSLKDLDYANSKNASNNDFAGIGTICVLCEKDLSGRYQGQYELVEKIRARYEKEYLKDHPECSNSDAIPEADKASLLDKAIVVHAARRKAQAEISKTVDITGKLTNDSPLRSVLDEAIKEVSEDPLVKARIGNKKIEFRKADPNLRLMIVNKAKTLYLDKIENDALASLDNGTVKAQAQAPEANPTEPVKTARLTGRAAQLAEILNKLGDAKSVFDTTLSHGMTKQCKAMYNNMTKLMQMTKDLMEKEINDPENFSEQDWEDFQKQIRETFDASCFYISQKPLNPIHQYGKDRLDAAHELRSQVLDAIQMAENEITAHKKLEDPYVSVNRTEQKEAVKETSQKDIQKTEAIIVR